MAQMLTLTFHGIGQPPHELRDDEAAVWLSRDEFESVLDELRDRTDIRLTFDDGNVSDVAIALPALSARGLTATFFVVAERLDQTGYLRREDLVALRAAGMRIGCHGMRHVSWRSLDRAALVEELSTARSQIEDAVGAPTREASCPFGAYDRRVLAALRAEGYERVYTSDGGWGDARWWLQPRTTLRRSGPAVDDLVASARGVTLTRLRSVAKSWR
jgi:peptidoglycan/xylan/chitin deacetylase (PgdA/CDA1 family)